MRTISARHVRWLLALVVAVALLRIATTWRVFAETVDEAAHIAAGLQLLQFHRYDLHPQNPPLPAAVMAAIPWMSGMRLAPHGSFTEQLHSVFYGTTGRYESKLARVRAGNLLFFLLAVCGVWFSARGSLEEQGALLAVFLFTTEPLILGHAGLATYDVPATAGVACALAAFARWLRKPGLRNAALFGAMTGLSVIFKLSCLGFVPMACLAMFAVRIAHSQERRSLLQHALRSLLPAIAVSLFVIWAGYGFSVGRGADLQPLEAGVTGWPVALLAHVGPSTPIPAPALFRGVLTDLAAEQKGFQSYLCGEIRMTGWWWYFPFAILLKTTLPTLGALLVGGWFALRSSAHRWQFLEWLAAAMAIVAVTLPSSLDIGVRYVLPFYGPLAVAIATGLSAMWMAPARVVRWAAALLIAAQLLVSAGAHPDYFPYFNALAGRDPSLQLVDSNLDWGQDVLRLRSVIRKRKIDHIGLALLSAADFDALGFPPHEYPVRSKNPTGWIAYSDHAFHMDPPETVTWLPETYERIGKSIRLYYVKK